MELTLERSELAVLVLHTNIMRNPIKKGLKKNYGHLEGRKKLKIYDSLKERFQEELTEEIDAVVFDLDEDELTMLHSFLNWYLLEVKLSAEEQRVRTDQDEQVIILESITKKVNRFIEVQEYLV